MIMSSRVKPKVERRYNAKLQKSKHELHDIIEEIQDSE